ncbi:MAG: hypothetical protein ABSD49_10405 [Candidatus Bathyarchaeia archaeon]
MSKRECEDTYTIPIVQKLPPDSLKALNDLKRHESTLLAQLTANPRLAERFVTDPAAVLMELKIPVDNQLREQLKALRNQPSFLSPRSFCLPNGKQVTAKINVKFVPHKEER